MNIEWEKLSERKVYDGYRKILRRVFKMPDGHQADFDVKLERAAACVFALTKNNEVIVAKQYRSGPEKVLFELPGGVIESGETSEEAIKRELLEETQYTGKFTHLGQFFSCGYSTRITHAFLATECEFVGGGNRDENEFIEVVLLPLQEFEKVLDAGDLSDTATALKALRYLGL